MRFKRIFSALCIAFLFVIQCVPVYAAEDFAYNEIERFQYKQNLQQHKPAHIE